MTRAVQKPDTGVFLALVSLAAHLGRGYVIVTQNKLLERVRRTTAYRSMSRRTLNRHLAALQRMAFINRPPRARPNRYGEMRQLATLYTFGALGILWINRFRQAATIVLGRPRVPEMAHSQKTLSLSERRLAVDKAFTARQSRPRTRGRGTAPRSSRRTRSSSSSAATRH